MRAAIVVKSAADWFVVLFIVKLPLGPNSFIIRLIADIHVRFPTTRFV